MSDEEISLVLTVTEVNLILTALGKQPYEQVAALIPKVKEQGENQLRKKQEDN